MFNSNKAVYMKELNYYEDMTKFGKLGAWILNALGAEIDDLSDLIGDMPSIKSNRELNEADYELIRFAKNNNLDYTITEKGIKLML